MSNKVIADIALRLEDLAGATQEANQSVTGWWLRIALAAEALASTGLLNANESISGYMRRASYALAVVTDGEFEDPPTDQPDAYLASMIANLEAYNGESYEGSAIWRLWLGVSGLEPGGSASLDLNFLTSPHSDVVTHTRASSTTYFDADGVMQTAAVNEWPLNHRYVDGVWVPAGRGIWGQATNLHLRSNFSTSWVLNNVSLNESAVIAPDGSLARKIVEDSSTGLHRIYRAVSVPLDGVYTASVFAKAAERTVLSLMETSTVGGTLFDLEAGTVITGDGEIESVGDGWYRCSIARLKTDAGVANWVTQIRLCNEDNQETYTGDGSSGLYIWGAQLEEGPFPTPYIPTEGSPVTRAADSAIISGTDFSDWWTETGTIVIEAGSAAIGTRVAFQADDDTADNRITIWLDDTTAKATIVTGGVEQAEITLGEVVPNKAFKIALAMGEDYITASLDGGAAQSASGITMPTVDRCRIGHDTTGNHLAGHVRIAKFYNQPLPGRVRSLST